MIGDCESFRRTVLHDRDRKSAVITDEAALHLDECPDCRRLFDLGKVDLPKETFEVLDESTRWRIVEALGATRLRMPRKRRRTAFLTAAAALVIVATGLAWLGGDRSAQRRVADALVEDHIRYLNDPDRRGGGNSRELERYFEPYVDFPVVLAVPPETHLTGGRRCFVLGRRVALIFYETAHGPASYFVFAADGMRPPGRRCPGGGELSCAASRGYRLVSWEDAGLLHVFVGSPERLLLEMARACRISAPS
jgi:hypothetical protein